MAGLKGEEWKGVGNGPSTVNTEKSKREIERWREETEESSGQTGRDAIKTQCERGKTTGKEKE